MTIYKIFGSIIIITPLIFIFYFASKVIGLQKTLIIFLGILFLIGFLALGTYLLTL